MTDYISKGERERGGQVGTDKKLRERQVLSQFLSGRKGKALTKKYFPVTFKEGGS